MSDYPHLTWVLTKKNHVDAGTGLAPASDTNNGYSNSQSTTLGMVVYPNHTLVDNINMLRGRTFEMPNLAQLCRQLFLMYWASPFCINEYDSKIGVTADGHVQVPPLRTHKERVEFFDRFLHHVCFLIIRASWPVWMVLTAEAKCHQHESKSYPDLMYIVQVCRQMHLARSEFGLLTGYYCSGKVKVWLVHRRISFDLFVLKRAAGPRDHGYAGILLDYESYPNLKKKDAHRLQWEMEQGFETYQFPCCPDTTFYSNKDAVEMGYVQTEEFRVPYFFPRIDLLYESYEEPIIGYSDEDDITVHIGK